MGIKMKKDTEKESIRLKKVFILAGALCAYWIGSGFATGQEVLQFFSIYGLNGIAGAIIFLVLIGLFTYILFGIGNKMKFKNPYGVFDYYCGKFLGQVYAWYNVVLIYCIFVVMLAGAGATINQHFGIPAYIGTAIIAILALGTALLGIEKLIQIIGVIGPIKILLIVIVGMAAIATFWGKPDLLVENSKLMPTLGFNAASPNWAWSAVLYAFGTLVFGIPFIVDCGASAGNLKEARTAGITSAIAFTIAIILLIISELVYCNEIVGQQVPTLAMASYISPVLGFFFTVLIVVCIYSSVASCLLMTVRKFAQDKTKKFYITAVIFAAIGTFFGGVLPFDKLVNLIYPLSGYSAMLFICLVILKMIRERISANRG